MCERKKGGRRGREKGYKKAIFCRSRRACGYHGNGLGGGGGRHIRWSLSELATDGEKRSAATGEESI